MSTFYFLIRFLNRSMALSQS
ncbi:hypothetical protein RSAG8_00862, partial [Rhizoctonia solani AG-8 WAC10335]